MPRRIRTAGRTFGVALGVTLLVWTLVPSGATAAPQPMPGCVAVSSEARFRGYGYYHVVRVANGCEKSVACNVSTDVNPTPESITVDPNQVTEVVTFRGSPAREFVPHVECRLL